MAFRKPAFGLLYLLATNSYALSYPPYTALLSIGPAWANAGKSQTITLQPELFKTYSANKATGTLANGELFLGVQQAINEKIQAAMGFVVAGNGTAKLSGDIWEDADPAFNNYKYTYNLNQFRMGAKVRLIGRGYHLISHFFPYLSGSAGIGFNHAYHYEVTSSLFQEIAAPDFGSQTTTSFSYTLSAGLQKIVNTHWQVGIGYEFADWGANQLKKAPGQTSGSGLAMAHSYTNGLQLLLSYQA